MVSSPSAQKFLTVNEEAEKLIEDMREIFNSVTEKLLYLEKGHAPKLKQQYIFCAPE